MSHAPYGPHWPGPKDVHRMNALGVRAGGPTGIREAVQTMDSYRQSIRHREAKGQPIPRAGWSIVPRNQRPKAEYESEALWNTRK